jgi:hypothetical protein
MSQFEEKLSEAMEAANVLGIPVDEDLLSKIAKGLGPALYNSDASLVSSSDQAELDRVKENFLRGKLGCANESEMDQAIQYAIDTLGAGNRNKLRTLFYYLCVDKLNKASVYNP